MKLIGALAIEVIIQYSLYVIIINFIKTSGGNPVDISGWVVLSVVGFRLCTLSLDYVQRKLYKNE